VAYALAILDDPAIPHPELELLCTVQEEVALVGIRNFDLGLIRSRRMINLDAGNSHTMCLSAAGGRIVRFEKRHVCLPGTETALLHLHIRGGLGGHAGILAHKNRACCINVMGELLFLLSRELPVALAEITADGPAIHGSCEAYIRIPSGEADRAASLLEAQFHVIAERYSQTDPDLEFSVCAQACDKPALSPEDSANIIRAMFLLHTGVRKRDADDPSIVITSVTFSSISLLDGVFKGKYVVRSVEDSVGLLWHHRMEELLRILGFTVSPEHEYPAWPRGGKRVMQSRFAQEHRRLFGSEIRRLHEHASIEANVILRGIPDMDAVAIQPTAVDFHTTDETLFIDEVQPFWDLLLAVLAQKG